MYSSALHIHVLIVKAKIETEWVLVVSLIAIAMTGAIHFCMYSQQVSCINFQYRRGKGTGIMDSTTQIPK
jgi:hypothetical protein